MPWAMAAANIVPLTLLRGAAEASTQALEIRFHRREPPPNDDPALAANAGPDEPTLSDHSDELGEVATMDTGKADAGTQTPTKASRRRVYFGEQPATQPTAVDPRRALRYMLSAFPVEVLTYPWYVYGLPYLIPGRGLPEIALKYVLENTLTPAVASMAYVSTHPGDPNLRKHLSMLTFGHFSVAALPIQLAQFGFIPPELQPAYVGVTRTLLVNLATPVWDRAVASPPVGPESLGTAAPDVEQEPDINDSSSSSSSSSPSSDSDPERRAPGTAKPAASPQRWIMGMPFLR